MNRYDVIYSLGRDCSCAMYMRQTNLRSCSGPFDWLTHAGFEKRFEFWQKTLLGGIVIVKRMMEAESPQR